MMETERKKAATEIVVAIDHGLSFPETVGLERPIDLLRELVSLPEVDGLIATAGMYRQAERNGIDLGQYRTIRRQRRRCLFRHLLLADFSIYLQ